MKERDIITYSIYLNGLFEKGLFLGFFRDGQRSNGSLWIGFVREIVLIGLSFFQYYD
jgi:hypothetical protein